MEIFELKYFLGVAQLENIHRASERLKISPASLSKTIARLEDELQAKLFSREGRNIVLTDHGRLLQKKAAQIVQLEEAARFELSGHRENIRCVVTGSEALLSKWGFEIAGKLEKKYPSIDFEFQPASDSVALRKVLDGEAQIAIVSSEAPSQLSAKTLGAVSFQTCVGKGHPLHSAARAGKVVPIAEILRHAFASTSHAFLGQMNHEQSLDGWRDDKFPRRSRYVTGSLKVLQEWVVRGQALAYLPDFCVEALKDVEVLKISGCPYTCTQKIRMVAREPQNLGWLHQLF